MSTSKFYFGELLFGSEQASLLEFCDEWEKPTFDTIKEQLIEYINSKEPVYVEDDAEWRFGKSAVKEDYVIGKFGKVFSDEPTQYDDSIGDFVTSKQEDADVSYFILFFDSLSIAFNRRHRIGPDQFTTAFSSGFNIYDFDTPSERLTMALKEWSDDLDSILISADRFYSMDFDLETTNPGPTKEMEEMDNRFREAGADEFGVEMESDKGLNIDAGIVNAAITFIKESYGNGIFKFERDGRDEEYNTRTKTATKTLKEPEELGDMESHLQDLSDQVDALLGTEDDD